MVKSSNSPQNDSAVTTEVPTENMVTIHGFLRDSYQHAKQHLQDGVLFFRTEFSFIHNKSSEYLTKMILPVNNFLKDITQIETELEQELAKETTHCLCIDGQMVPAEIVLSQPMEENY